MHVRKIKLKSGMAHQVIYWENKKKRYKYFGPKISENHVNAWVKNKDKELAYQRAGMEKFYEHEKYSKLTIEEFIEWYKNEKRGLVKKSTIERNILALKNLMKLIGEEFDFQKIKIEDIKNFIKHKLEKNYLRSGINREIGELRVVFNFAVANKIIPQSPLDGIKLLNIPKKAQQVLTEKEISCYEKTLDSETMKIAFKIIRYTGCRRRSIARGYDWEDILKWEDIDLDNGIMKIIQKGGHELIIPIHRELLAFLRMKYHGQSGPVINVHADTISAEFSKAFKKAGIKKDVRPVHVLRHSAATKLLEAGVDIKLISRILGHTKITTTENYTHPSINALRKPVNKL